MVKRFDKDFYDEEYFTGSSKSNYGKLNPNGGYTKDLYLPFKIQQGAGILRACEYTSRWLPDNCLVFGCAIGYLVEAMRVGTGLRTECRGHDISEYAIDRGTKEGIKGLHCGDVVIGTTFADNQFELVISMELLEHIPEDDGQLDKAMDEHLRVCNGYLVIGTPLGQDDEHPQQLEGDPSHFSVHTPEWWIDKFEKKGAKLFKEIRVDETVMIIFEVEAVDYESR